MVDPIQFSAEHVQKMLMEAIIDKALAGRVADCVNKAVSQNYDLDRMIKDQVTSIMRDEIVKYIETHHRETMRAAIAKLITDETIMVVADKAAAKINDAIKERY